MTRQAGELAGTDHVLTILEFWKDCFIVVCLPGPNAAEVVGQISIVIDGLVIAQLYIHSPTRYLIHNSGCL